MSPSVTGPTRPAGAMTRFLYWLDNYTIWACSPPAARGGHAPIRPESQVAAPMRGDLVCNADDQLVTVAQCIDSALEHVRSLKDPAERVREVESLAGRVSSMLDTFRAEAAPAVRSLRRQGLSFVEISERTGLPQKRVIELARLTRCPSR